MEPKRVDSNQKEIVNELRQYGCHVTDTHVLGRGFPDLVVTWRGWVFLVEIKNNKKSTFTEPEKKFIAEVKAEVIIATTFDEAIEGIYNNIANHQCNVCRSELAVYRNRQSRIYERTKLKTRLKNELV